MTGVSTAELEAARLLLARMGISPNDLLNMVPRALAPTFAEYVPIVSAAVSAGTRRVYGSYWNRVVERWGQRRLDKVSASDIERLLEDVKGFKVLPRRWVVERIFGWLIRYRRLARDYERLTANSEAMIKVAMIRLMTIRRAGQTVRWSNATSREAARRIDTERLIAA